MARVIDEDEAVRIGRMLHRGQITVEEAIRMVDDASVEVDDRTDLSAELDAVLRRAGRS